MLVAFKISPNSNLSNTVVPKNNAHSSGALGTPPDPETLIVLQPTEYRRSRCERDLSKVDVVVLQRTFLKRKVTKPSGKYGHRSSIGSNSLTKDRKQLTHLVLNRKSLRRLSQSRRRMSMAWDKMHGLWLRLKLPTLWLLPLPRLWLRCSATIEHESCTIAKR